MTLADRLDKLSGEVVELMLRMKMNKEEILDYMANTVDNVDQ